MENNQLIINCLQGLKEQGVDVDKETFKSNNNVESKGEVTLKGIVFQYIILKEVRPWQVFQLRHEYQEAAQLLLMAQYITPKAKDALRSAGLNYIETNGNAFIQSGNLYIFIEKQHSKIPKESKPDQAFTKAGLKVTFQFLCDPDLLKSTYRTIAHHAGVALGNLTKVINGLKKDGYLLKTENGWEISNYETLLEKWVDAYQEKLQPTLFVKRYKPVRKDFFKNWETYEVNHDTQWGGEPAGAILTRYLKPSTLTIYTKEPANQLMRNYHWKPDPEGPITVYRPFWKGRQEFRHVVHPVLVYADLINTDNDRCMETARKIYEEYVRPISLQTL